MERNIIIELKRIRDYGEIEKSIANYILYNLKAIENIDIRTLATNANVSPSAITRFVKTLDYRGFKEFKYELSKYNYRQEVKGKNLNTSKVEKTLQKVKKVLKSNHNILNANDFEEFANLIINHKKIYVFANGGSYEAAYDLTIKLQRYGLSAMMSNDNLIQKSLASIPENSNESVFLIISSSGQTPHLVEIAQKLFERKKTLISITSNSDNKIRKLSKLSLVFQAENDVINSLIGSNRIILNVIVEIILTTVLEKKQIDLNRIIKTVN